MEPTWETMSNLLCGGLLYDYLRRKRANSDPDGASRGSKTSQRVHRRKKKHGEAAYASEASATMFGTAVAATLARN
ncbi:hypothetical protein GQ600_7481 [Phytophthora cactorum]|nr:hypothetical protein GQ600_7481 [Phytophthora cactorum]